MFESLLENFNGKIKLVEVGPRDGLQNERNIISTPDKITLILNLVEAGLSTIEAASFVHPERVPQMADGEELLKKLFENPSLDPRGFPVLVPNRRGLERALGAGATSFSLLIAVSETFSKKNTNTTLEQSLKQREEILSGIRSALGSKASVRHYISTVFGCPYRGNISVKEVMGVVEKLLPLLGKGEIVLGDTVGGGTPGQVDILLKELLKVVEPTQVALHFHDTRGMAIANILVGLNHGIRTYDCSIGGLGGCPYAPGASGNVATEEVVYLMESLGLSTGVSMEKLWEAPAFLFSKLDHCGSSRLRQAPLFSN